MVEIDTESSRTKMTTPFLNFSIETTGGSSQGCWHETVYRLKQLHTPFSHAQIKTLDDMALLGSGQELSYTLFDQERIDSGDGMNFYFTLNVTRVCDSGD